MSQLLSIFAVTFPIFALVLCGYVATRRGVLPVGAIPGLSVYILSFALPALLFKLGMGTPLNRLLDGPLMLVYVLCAAAIIGATICLSRHARMGLKDAAFGAVVGVYPNAGFMGIPLLVVLFGEVGVRVIILTMLVDLFLVISSCLAIVQMPEKQAGNGLMSSVVRGIGRAFAGALKGAVSNPLLWPVAAGIAWGALGPELPAPVSKTLTMLADTASPVALFAIGAILARNALTSTQTTPVADYLPIALVKLLVHPALVYTTGLAFMASGVMLETRSLAALTLVAALPPAINITMLAERFGADSGRIARIIMAATVLSFFSLTAVVWLLGVGPTGS